MWIELLISKKQAKTGSTQKIKSAKVKLAKPAEIIQKTILRVDERGLEIGRRIGSIGLDDNRISKTHLLLVEKEGHLMLIDLGSKNGTYLNRKKIERGELTVGSSIRIGKTTLTLMSKRS